MLAAQRPSDIVSRQAQARHAHGLASDAQRDQRQDRQGGGHWYVVPAE
jgi:hypothetical protein